MTQHFFSHWHCLSTFSCQDQFICDTSENGPSMSTVSFMDMIAWVKLGRRTWSHIRNSMSLVVKHRTPYESVRVKVVIWVASSRTVFTPRDSSRRSLLKLLRLHLTGLTLETTWCAMPNVDVPFGNETFARFHLSEVSPLWRSLVTHCP